MSTVNIKTKVEMVTKQIHNVFKKEEKKEIKKENKK